jgi:hypothetical protein
VGEKEGKGNSRCSASSSYRIIVHFMTAEGLLCASKCRQVIFMKAVDEGRVHRMVDPADSLPLRLKARVDICEPVKRRPCEVHLRL